MRLGIVEEEQAESRHGPVGGDGSDSIAIALKRSIIDDMNQTAIGKCDRIYILDMVESRNEQLHSATTGKEDLRHGFISHRTRYRWLYPDTAACRGKGKEGKSIKAVDRAVRDFRNGTFYSDIFIVIIGLYVQAIESRGNLWKAQDCASKAFQWELFPTWMTQARQMRETSSKKTDLKTFLKALGITKLKSWDTCSLTQFLLLQSCKQNEQRVRVRFSCAEEQHGFD